MRLLEILDTQNLDMPHLLTLSHQQTMRIGRCRPIIEPQINVLGVRRNVDERRLQPAGEGILKRHPAVGGVNQSRRVGCLFEHHITQRKRNCAHGRVVNCRNWSSRVQAALRLLADTGLGGERSRGWGRFELEPVEDRPLHQLLNIGSVNADQAQGHWLLSLFQPSQSDAVDWGQGHYSLVTRSGRAEGSRDWLKKPARMVAEGSVLVADGQLTGSAENVAPEGFAHPVYRAGFAVSIPVPLRPIS